MPSYVLWDLLIFNLPRPSHYDMPTIKLDLSRHCIQTELKRLYNKKIYKYFKAPKRELELEIEILKKLLERLDFTYLRSKFIEFRGGYDGEIYLEVIDGKEVVIGEIEGNNMKILMKHQI